MRNLKEATPFKTMRHIETVRNYINAAVMELLKRGEIHDQTKLQSPEIEAFDEITQNLRGLTYGSEEYRKIIVEQKPTMEHHYAENPHHPEHYANGIKEMDIFDIIEMLCDWKAASLRHNNGDVYKSININQNRFGFSDELKDILINTVRNMEKWPVRHLAKES